MLRKKHFLCPLFCSLNINVLEIFKRKYIEYKQTQNECDQLHINLEYLQLFIETQPTPKCITSVTTNEGTIVHFIYLYTGWNVYS